MSKITEFNNLIFLCILFLLLLFTKHIYIIVINFSLLKSDGIYFISVKGLCQNFFLLKFYFHNFSLKKKSRNEHFFYFQIKLFKNYDVISTL